MEVEDNPATLGVGVKDCQLYFFVIMVDYEVGSLVNRLVHLEVLDI